VDLVAEQGQLLEFDIQFVDRQSIARSLQSSRRKSRLSFGIAALSIVWWQRLGSCHDSQAAERVANKQCEYFSYFELII
jgi:hypothetical protein